MPEQEIRKKRTFWFDPRFAIGLGLVVASVFGVVGLVAQANASVDVLAARTALTPGEKVSASDLVPTSVRAGQTEKLYLTARQVPSAGVIVTRSVAAGELIPDSAVGSFSGVGLTSVVVNLNGELAGSIAPGSRVDLWSAAQASTTSVGEATTRDPGVFDAPTVIVSSATVVRIVNEKSVVSTSSTSIELLVPKSETASVLDAIANGAALSIVPVDLPLGQ